MYRKLFAIITIIMITVFSFSVVLAADNTSMVQDAVNGVRGAVGGAENAIENGVRDISNTSKDMTGDMENDASRGTNGTTGTTNNSNANTDSATGTTGNKSNSYTATRTAGESNATFMGMGSTAWTWLIIGVAAIAIVALVWYYGTQLNSSDNNRD